MVIKVNFDKKDGFTREMNYFTHIIMKYMVLTTEKKRKNIRKVCV